MPIAYKSPGVYREEVFPQPEIALPTGVPVFVGFADAIATLETLPAGVQFPDSLKDKIQYDSTQKRLVFVGRMAIEQRDQLLALSSDAGFRKAIEGLFLNAQAVVSLRRKQEFIENFQGSPTGYLMVAVVGFFENGGSQCYLARADAKQGARTALEETLDLLKPLINLDLVAVPDAMTLQTAGQLDTAAILQVQQRVVTHCTQQGDRMAILDAFPGSTIDQVRQHRLNLLQGQTEPVNAALYFPWLKNAQGQLVPPCGHVAGIFARSDTTRGVFKAPANEEVRDALDLEIAIDNVIQDQLNPDNINCLRAFPGRGIRLWGARTLSRDPNWRYVNVRRVFLTLGRWIQINMRWASFEPNSPRLWVRMQRELSTYLEALWQAGALQGQTPQQAFYVKCDAETNPLDRREAGEVMTEIGLATAAPAEFLVVQIIHRAGDIEISA